MRGRLSARGLGVGNSGLAKTTPEPPRLRRVQRGEGRQSNAQQMTGAHTVYKTHLQVPQATVLRHFVDSFVAFFSRTRRSDFCMI
jgi:hypothetical protein